MRVFLYFLGAWVLSSMVIGLVIWIGALKTDRERRKRNIMRQVNASHL